MAGVYLNPEFYNSLAGHYKVSVNLGKGKKFKLPEDFIKRNNINTKKVKLVGYGSNGCAFDVGKGRILKITSQEKEFNSVKKAMDYNPKYLVKYYDAIVLNRYNLFAILMEKLNTKSRIAQKYKNRTLDFLYYDAIDCGKILDPETYELRKMYTDLSRIQGYEGSITNNLLDCLPELDIHANNIGVDRHGNLKAFDLWLVD